MNVWNYCFLSDLLLPHSDKNTKKRQKKIFQVALKEKEQKEQNLFKWSITDKKTAQVNQVRFLVLLLKQLRNKSFVFDVLTVNPS